MIPNNQIMTEHSRGGIGRRRAARLVLAGALVAGLASCGGAAAGQWHETNIKGALPDLKFTMTRADDGQQVTAADYQGKVTALYFGYTFCPDVCPTTLTNLAQALHKLGDKAKDVRVLFVTVDPNRDTPAVLKQYVNAFAPQIDGLRGTPDQLAAFAKLYRVAYSVTPAHDGKPYEVSHGSAVYIFDQTGKVRLLASSLASQQPDVPGLTADLTRLIDEQGGGGMLGWLKSLFS